MGGNFFLCAIVLSPSSVVIHDLDIVRVPFAPGKADPPAVVNANAMLAGPVPFQRLQPVPPDCRQIGKARGRMQPAQPFPRLFFDPAILAAGIYAISGSEPAQGCLSGRLNL